MSDDEVTTEGNAVESTSGDDVTEVGEKVEGDEVTTDANGAATDLDSSADESAEIDTDDAEPDETEATKPRMSHVQVAMIAGLVVVLALGGLTGWLGFRAYESYKADEQRNLFLQVGRQGALNLTSINFEHADADVQRILDSATGTFYDDFQQRAQPFIEVVKQAQSKSEGTIAEAGLESVSENAADVLVAVTVKTSNAGAPEQQPRAWRMRLTVEKVDDQAKVSNVEFVP